MKSLKRTHHNGFHCKFSLENKNTEYPKACISVSLIVFINNEPYSSFHWKNVKIILKEDFPVNIQLKILITMFLPFSLTV